MFAFKAVSGFNMTSTQIFKFQPDTEGIVSVKRELKEKECEDSVLLSNLDYAERIFRRSPLSSSMSLLVVGKWQCVRIGMADDLIYSVILEDGQVHLDSYIYCDKAISESDVKSVHFSMHSCQSEEKSCFQRAKLAAKTKDVEALKVVCNRFSVMYATKDSPEKIVTIRTKCQFKLEYITVERLLERKCWMEREKAGCKVLIAGLDYLINRFLTVANPPTSDCKFVIQGDGEIIEITSNIFRRCQEYFILLDSESQKISMYPPSWNKS